VRTEDCLCTQTNVAPVDSLVGKLIHLYVCLQQSTYAIADQTGDDHQRVARLLASAGITLRPRGAGGRRPHRRDTEPADLPRRLAELYTQQGLSSETIARLLGMPARTVRERLAEAGIPRRTPGNRPRDKRRLLPADELDALYVRAGLSAAETGQVLDASRGIVLGNSHDLGLPVRVGGPPPARGPSQIQLIDALYSDALVARTLERHHVPIRPAGGRLWERFPEPVKLTTTLLTDLYEDCGVSTSHIQLLTGVPVSTVTKRLNAAGIQTRPSGGRCPFLQRWRRGQPGSARTPSTAP
jgi:DNA invertase Pin-like site-specific DNA recombinase